VDQRGAVRLDLPATELTCPQPLHPRDAAKLECWASRSRLSG
jgi:hypothetical protein